ncbi:MAG: right-handed parallel beta-helix repeat-containing protein [Planctomycetota bacterium]
MSRRTLAWLIFSLGTSLVILFIAAHPADSARPARNALELGIIESLPVTLKQPGIYRLAESMNVAKGGIRVESDDVVVDLSGQRIVGRTDGAGVTIAGARRNVTVRNGTLVGFGTAAILGAESVGLRVEDVTVRDGRGDGLVVGAGASVVNCRVLENRGVGIVAGIGSRLQAMTILSNGSDGVRVGAGSLILQTTVIGNGGIGIVPGDETVLSEVTATGNAVSGIEPADNIRLSAYTGQGQRK